MDRDLLDEIHSAAASTGVDAAGEAQSAALLNVLSARFIIDPKQTWWWTSIRGEREALPYAHNRGLELLDKLVPGGTPVFVAVSDDEHAPWPVYSGTLSNVLQLLSNVRFCEYALFDRDCTWVIFDTHDNQLVVAGELVARARGLSSAT